MQFFFLLHKNQTPDKDAKWPPRDLTPRILTLGRGVNQSYRGRKGSRGGSQPERPTVNPNKESLKFEGDYDFDTANEEFKVMLTAEKRRNAGKTQKENSNQSKSTKGETEKEAKHILKELQLT